MLDIKKRVRIRIVIVGETCKFEANSPTISEFLLNADIYVEGTASSLGLGLNPLSILLLCLPSVSGLFLVVDAPKNCLYSVC